MSSAEIAMMYVAVAGGLALVFFFVVVTKRLKLSVAILQAVGIVVVIVAVCALAFSKQVDGTAAIGVLGAVAGYLFGAAASSHSGTVSADNVGDGNTIVGRDLNQQIDELKAEAVNLSQSVASLQELDDQRRKMGTVILEVVTPRAEGFSDDSYVRLVESVLRRMARSHNRLVSWTGPHASRQSDFSSSVFVFETDRHSDVSRISCVALGARVTDLPRWDSDELWRPA